jgi:hypothetical protein
VKADGIKALLRLEPNQTCGFVRETYKSALQIAPGGLPAPFANGRLLGSALYFMVTPEAPVKLHRIKNDQLYHYYLGDPLVGERGFQSIRISRHQRREIGARQRPRPSRHAEGASECRLKLARCHPPEHRRREPQRAEPRFHRLVPGERLPFLPLGYAWSAGARPAKGPPPSPPCAAVKVAASSRATISTKPAAPPCARIAATTLSSIS